MSRKQQGNLSYISYITPSFPYISLRKFIQCQIDSFKIREQVKCYALLDKFKIEPLREDKVNECLEFYLDTYKPYRPKGKKAIKKEIKISKSNLIRIKTINCIQNFMKNVGISKLLHIT